MGNAAENLFPIGHAIITFAGVKLSCQKDFNTKGSLYLGPLLIHSISDSWVTRGLVVVVWQLSCQGSYHLLKCDCVADAVPLYQYTHWNWYSFRRPRKDDRLSQPPGVLIQRPTGLELRTRGSQAATRTTEPTPGYKRVKKIILSSHRRIKFYIILCIEQENENLQTNLSGGVCQCDLNRCRLTI